MLTARKLDAARADLESLSIAAAKETRRPVYELLNKIVGKQDPVYTRSVTGFGLAETVDDGGTFAQDDLTKLPKLTIQPKQRGKSWTWTTMGQETAHYDMVRRVAKAAARSLAYRDEYDATNLLFNNAFDSNYPIASGDPLFSDSHTLATQTFDNLYTATALSYSALSGAMSQLRQQTDARNLVMPFVGGVVLLVGAANETVAATIAQSMKVPGTADNDANVLASRIKVVVADHAAPSSTKWVLLPQMADEHTAYKYIVREPFLNDEKVADGHVRYVLQSIKGYGVENPYNTIGSAGA